MRAEAEPAEPAPVEDDAAEGGEPEPVTTVPVSSDEVRHPHSEDSFEDLDGLRLTVKTQR